MDRDELIKFKYKLECIRDKELSYKRNKYYTLINPNNIIYTGNKDISLYELEENIDIDGFIKIFEKYQEDYIASSVNNDILFDEMRINIYYFLLVDKYELEMIINDYEVENREYSVVPREVECLDNICVLGGVNFELYKDNIKVDERDLKLDDKYYVIYYDDFKNCLMDKGYDNFKIGDFNDLENSIYDSRSCCEELSIKFIKNKIRIKNK